MTARGAQRASVLGFCFFLEMLRYRGLVFNPRGRADGRPDHGGALLYFGELASWGVGTLLRLSYTPLPLHSLCREAACVLASKRVVRPIER